MKRIIGLAIVAAMLLAAVFTLASCAVETSTKVKVIDIKLSEEEYAFAVSKGDDKMRADLNAFLAEIKENGKFEEILNKYFGDGTPTAVTSATKDNSKRDTQLWVATNSEFEPFEYKEGNKFYGIDMEIMALFAEKLGRELVIEDMNFESVVLSLGTDKCHVGAAGLTVEEDRKVMVDFTDSYYDAAQIMVVRDNDTTFDECKTAEDVEKILKKLKKKDQIGGQKGTTGIKYIDENKDIAAKSKGYSSGALAMQDMMNGKVKFVILDEAPAKTISAKMNKLG